MSLKARNDRHVRLITRRAHRDAPFANSKDRGWLSRFFSFFCNNANSLLMTFSFLCGLYIDILLLYFQRDKQYFHDDLSGDVRS